MNIFCSFDNPVLSAQFLDDKRLNKMITESSQLLSTALYMHGVNKDSLPNKPTHTNHPCAVWVRRNKSNYQWLINHMAALCNEKKKRWPNNPPHKAESYLPFYIEHSKLLSTGSLSDFENCAANASLGLSFKHLDVHTAYRMYLQSRWNLAKIKPRWYGSEYMPDWIKQVLKGK